MAGRGAVSCGVQGEEAWLTIGCRHWSYLMVFSLKGVVAYSKILHLRHTELIKYTTKHCFIIKTVKVNKLITCFRFLFNK